MTIYDNAPLIIWGRCRSGTRWFWTACEYRGEQAHGWADSEAAAIDQARAEANRLAAGRPNAHIYKQYGRAAATLKAINAEKRKARPPKDGEDTAPVEYLYSHTSGYDAYEDWQEKIHRFRITKRTPKRVYYVRREDDGAPVIGFVDRQELEAKGEVYNRGVHWCMPDHRLYLEPPEIHQDRPQKPDLKALKAAMAEAHPDAGGTDAAFIAARKRYVAARQQTAGAR